MTVAAGWVIVAAVSAGVAGCPECERIQSGRGLLVRGAFVVHAKLEPGAVPGWLLVAPRRHVEQLDELEEPEARELGALVREATAALRQAAAAEKIYLAVFAELLPHLHVHLVARPPDWPAAERGPALLHSARQADAAEAQRVALAALGLLARSRPGAGPRAQPGQAQGRSHRALLLSALVCPGLGQLANGERAKGVALIAVSVLATAWLASKLAARVIGRLPSAAHMADPFAWAQALAAAREESLGPLALGTLLLTVLWLYAAWDAHRHARG